MTIVNQELTERLQRLMGCEPEGHAVPFCRVHPMLPDGPTMRPLYWGDHCPIAEAMADDPDSELANLVHERAALRAEVGQLRSALERTEANFRLAVAGKPVRDMAETLAENRAALSASA